MKILHVNNFFPFSWSYRLWVLIVGNGQQKQSICTQR